jgi:hypothetical protein
MKHIIIGRYIIIMGLAVAGLIWNGEIRSISGDLMSTAEAVVGVPATPVSYAGVARRTTVSVATPGAGVAPANLGGPVNRVGAR